MLLQAQDRTTSIMEATLIDNDTRGWIMCLVSGVACVIGASIICVDLVIRLLPGKKDFRIQDSNAFLACSLSLSFGVMIFMALYSMLPEAKSYLKKGDIEEQPAGFILMGCFVGGFIGIQVISRLFHQFLPSHVVDCDHSHGEHALEGHTHSHATSRRTSSHNRGHGKCQHSHHSDISHHKRDIGVNGNATESTPLLASETPSNEHAHVGVRRQDTSDAVTHVSTDGPSRGRSNTIERRPSMVQVQKRVMSFVKDTKANCDETGPCFGYSDPCGQECFKHLSSRSANVSRAPTLLRTTTGIFHDMERVAEDDDETVVPLSPSRRTSVVHSRSRERQHSHYGHGEDDQEMNDSDSIVSSSLDLEAQHHHHVAENAFLSIGLQTSIAIALHKFPEGFITYATNHANPSLGFSVFMALFVHNISEGFAMALPLYMALQSRPRAMAWSSLLGGLSQPLGAGIAVLWFKLAKHTNLTPDSVFYGCLFATTAGIMVSVALQLFVESLSLNHNRNLSISFAFVGMALLGLSSAFTSHAH